MACTYPTLFNIKIDMENHVKVQSYLDLPVLRSRFIKREKVRLVSYHDKLSGLSKFDA